MSNDGRRTTDRLLSSSVLAELLDALAQANDFLQSAGPLGALRDHRRWLRQWARAGSAGILPR